MKNIIFNLDIYFQCAGNCPGCFLSQEERLDNQFVPHIFQNDFFQNIKKMIEEKLKEETELLIIGFGRGNILSAASEDIIKLAEIIQKLDESFSIKKKFEISTSLIGKIDTQIQKANILLNASNNLYFNVVINSDIISKKFWNNWSIFYKHNRDFRRKKQILDDGDILVLNINPDNLPYVNQLYEHLMIDGEMIKSPINIAMFPYQRFIDENDLFKINQWMKDFHEKFYQHDLNYKNFLQQLKQFSINDLLTLNYYFENNQNSYVFIDKNNQIQLGSLSIMGEIDYHRLRKKFDLSSDLKSFLKIANKNTACVNCQHQTYCIVSGAYLVAIKNDNMKKNKVFLMGKSIQKFEKSNCLNGYQNLFEYYKK